MGLGGNAIPPAPWGDSHKPIPAASLGDNMGTKTAPLRRGVRRGVFCCLQVVSVGGASLNEPGTKTGASAFIWNSLATLSASSSSDEPEREMEPVPTLVPSTSDSKKQSLPDPDFFRPFTPLERLGAARPGGGTRPAGGARPGGGVNPSGNVRPGGAPRPGQSVGARPDGGKEVSASAALASVWAGLLASADLASSGRDCLTLVGTLGFKAQRRPEKDSDLIGENEAMMVDGSL